MRYVELPLYFNPENDIICLDDDRIDGWLECAGPVPPAKPHLFDFIHDLKAYDPRGVGLRRTADTPRIFRNFDAITPALQDPPVKDSWVQFLSTVDELIWSLPVCDVRVDRELIAPHELQYSHAGGAAFVGDGQVDYSLPAKAATPFFELLGQDPRPLKKRMRVGGRRLFGGLERHDGVPLWLRDQEWPGLFEVWGIDRPPVQQSLLVQSPDFIVEETLGPWRSLATLTLSRVSHNATRLSIQNLETASELVGTVELFRKCEKARHKAYSPDPADISSDSHADDNSVTRSGIEGSIMEKRVC
ncbi:hypothetical protein B0T16DRAFT_496628 [Cercophora newfieldiana]|uniref:Uncharacterized protein n=1 Tax=Cercophora newfieldiana TaxID=92897 RepID=A0AA40CM49_9PEZI|nr:hypothetical protein B0T16DRAFT_496628 [Cercophora newfieldiana]